MRALTGLLLRIACSLALLISALPIRAGVVCVLKDRIVASCPMAAPRRMEQMACCRAVRIAPPAIRCPLCAGLLCSQGVRCVSVWRVAGTFVEPGKAKLSISPLLAKLAAPVAPSPEAFAPPFAGLPLAPDRRLFSPRVRAPDRGRAPPLAVV